VSLKNIGCLSLSVRPNEITWDLIHLCRTKKKKCLKTCDIKFWFYQRFKCNLLLSGYQAPLQIA